MDIFTIDFDKPLVVNKNGELIKIKVYKTEDNSVVKFGITAPENISVNREEIYRLKKQKEQL